MSRKELSRSRNRQQNRRRNRRRSNMALDFQSLEPRQLMAVTTNLDLSANLLEIVQTADDGPIAIQKNGLTGSYSITDGSGSINAPSMANLSIDTSGFAGNVTLTNNSFISGDLTVQLGDFDGTFRYEGKGSVGGSLKVFGDVGRQRFFVSPSQQISIGADLVADLGGDNDEVTVDNANIGGDILLTNTNDANFDGIDLLGDATYTESGLLANSIFSFQNSTIAGNISHVGADGFDAFGLLNTTVDGNVSVQMNDNYAQIPFFNQSAYVLIETTTVGGALSVSSGLNTLSDVVEITDFNIAGPISIDLGGGENSLAMTGGFLQASTFSYRGLDGTDTVTFDPLTSTPLAATFELGDGADMMTLGGGTFQSLLVDFADTTPDSNDEFINDWSPDATAPVTIADLYGFTWAFDGSDVVITQTMATSGEIEFGTRAKIYDGVLHTVLNSRWDNNQGNRFFAVAGNLSITMMDGTGNPIDMQFGRLLNGNMDIHMGTGDRTLMIDGELWPETAGNLTITGGTGDQTITGFTAEVGGDLMIDLGTGNDVMPSPLYPEIGGRATLIGVNELDTGLVHAEFANWDVVGDFYVDNRNDDTPGNFDLNNISVGGNFGYFGSEHTDQVTLDSSTIVGNVYVNFMGATDSPIRQDLTMARNMVVGGNVTVLANESINTSESVRIGGVGENAIGGSVFVDLAGGDNVFDFEAPIGGNRLVYRGNAAGAINDVAILSNSPSARANIVMGSGDDQFEVGTGSNFNDLRVEFGGGADILTNGLVDSGQKLAFNTRWLNLNGFSVFANATIDNTHFVQVGNTTGAPDSMVLEYGTGFLGAVGPDAIWRQYVVVDGGFTFNEFNPTASVSMQMANHSATEAGVIFSSAVEGGVRANLGDGDRQFSLLNLLTDGATPVGKVLRVIAGEGDQTVNLADAGGGTTTGAAFGSTFQTLVSLGEGHDELLHDLDLNIGGAFIVRDVNQYTNAQTVDVGFNMLFSTQDEFQATTFTNDGTINVANNLTWLGGNAVDTVNLNSGLTVNGAAFVDLAGGGAGNGAVQSLQILDSYFGSLTARAGGATFGNRITTGTNTRVGENLFVNFGNNSTNVMQLFGNVDAGQINIRGGEGSDNVRFGINADLLDAVINTFGDSDVVTLDTAADVNHLTINFGAAADQYFNDFGGFEPFEVELINL